MKISESNNIPHNLRDKKIVIHKAEENIREQEKVLNLSSSTSESVGQYNALGKEISIDTSMKSITSDIGTAADTTVFVNRNAFDSIVSYSTFNEPKWEELGVDNEKRWVVINGQRFEVPHSPEEIALRKRMQRTLVDMLNDHDAHKESSVDKGNKDILKANKNVVDILKEIFNLNSFDEVWQRII